MKNILIISCAIFLSACSPSVSDNANITRLYKNTLTHKAFYYYGLSEQNDRQLIKEIMGVDPVQTQWCAAFVNMILLENDLPQSSSVSRHPLTARSFLLWGEKVDEPIQGDILVFERGNSGWQGHVAFYVSETVIDGHLYYNVLGGNQGDAVTIDSYPSYKLLGIRRLPNNTSKVE